MESTMNYVVPPTMHIQQDDELSFQTSIPHHTHIIQDMLVDKPFMSVNTCQQLRAVKPKKPGSAIFCGEGGDESPCSKKKITHRDVERQRRLEMSKLYEALRAQVPSECLKGKRSISDHMTEAANYINHLKTKIQELTEKRDQLSSAIFSSSNLRSPYLKGSSSLSHLSVRATLTGAAVVIVSTPGYALPLSWVITALVEEGLNVISVSTCVNLQSIYNIECEGDDQRVDTFVLERKLREIFCLSN